MRVILSQDLGGRLRPLLWQRLNERVEGKKTGSWGQGPLLREGPLVLTTERHSLYVDELGRKKKKELPLRR